MTTPPPQPTLDLDRFSSQTADLSMPEVPGYKIERFLAKGGMGEVYLARHLTLDREVALKIMRPELASDAGYVDRFLREARAAARVAHPNVVTVHDAGQAGGHLYLAMEFVPGGDVNSRLRSGAMPERDAVELIIAACEGLQAIHDAGIVHRDLKPENLLLDAKGKPKIADLGLARQKSGDDRMTATGQAVGTPAYMSPEQANGDGELGPASDIYSLSATLFSLLTGRPPYVGPTPWATVAQVLHDPPPDPRTVDIRLSPSIAAVVLRGLAKTPGERPATATAFAAELRLALSGAGTAPKRPARGSGHASSRSRRRAIPWWRRRRNQVIGIAAAVVILIVLVMSGGKGQQPVFEPVSTGSPSTAPANGGESASTGSKNPFRDLKVAIRGTVSASFEAKVTRLHQAAVAAFASHGMKVTKDRLDGSTGVVEAEFVNGDEVRVTTTPVDADRSQAAVQIGAFGDEPRAKEVLRWIGAEL